MLRQHLIDRAQRGDRLFRWRGGDTSRVEGLTDGVFALAMTLLVVPLEIGGSRTFEDFEAIVLGAPVMALCLAFFVMVWQSHCRFHRRYGLEDGVTIWLNGGFLFVLLIGVYPLKLLAALLVAQFGGLDQGITFEAVGFEGVVWLMQVYAIGFGLIFLLLAAMVGRAWLLRDQLCLDPVERCLCLGELAGHGVMVAIAGLSFALASLGHPPYSGLVYAAIGPIQGLVGSRFGRRASALAAGRPAAEDSAA